ncbi:hypothetical protein [Parapedobacter lycopersici]|uniref:hypothetical protein n=1 Tax=Parapedobacter lycopersici TaxID=1864939 RepID=UPI003340E8BE
MQDIHLWLENQDYATGVALYEKYGTSQFLKELFAGRPSDYTRNKLFEELTKLTAPAVRPAERTAKRPEQTTVNTNKQYLKLCRDRDQTYRQIDRNMYQLDTCRTKPARHEIAKQILRLQRSKQRILAEIDYIDEHGQPMPAVAEKSIKTPEMQRLYVQICKAERRLQKTELRNRAKTEQLLAKKRARLEELRRERSGI